MIRELLVALGLLSPPLATFDVEPGWYRWADQRNSPARYAPREMAAYDMSARCLCADGFVATKSRDGKRFIVIKAPAGYHDTIGKEFIDGRVHCLNCAD